MVGEGLCGEQIHAQLALLLGVFMAAALVSPAAATPEAWDQTTLSLVAPAGVAAHPPIPPGWKAAYTDSHCYAAIPNGNGANWAIGSCNPPAGATPWRVVGYCSTISWAPKGKVYSAWQTGRVDTWTANCKTLNGGRQKIRDATIERW